VFLGLGDRRISLGKERAEPTEVLLFYTYKIVDYCGLGKEFHRKSTKSRKQLVFARLYVGQVFYLPFRALWQVENLPHVYAWLECQ